MNSIKFGTDGIRGSVESVVTPQFALKLGWAAGKVLAEKQLGSVVIGKDTRISGYMLESALEAGFIAAGVDVLLVGPVPTPAVAYLTRSIGALAGAMISASHNPFFDNGIKLFNADGGKISPELESGIEHYLNYNPDPVEARLLGRAARINDASGRYLEFCKQSLRLNQNLVGMSVVVDCANGSGYQIIPKLLRELGAIVHVVNDKPDGFNINANCGSNSTEALHRAMEQYETPYGLAVDGDADRVVFMDNHGRLYDGDDILYLLARSRYDWHSEVYAPSSRGVVGTQLSNFGLKAAMKELKVDFVRAEVGDRNVTSELQKRQWVLGAEESGHIINTEYHNTSDAAIAAVQVLDILKTQKQGFNECVQDFSRCRYPRIRHDIAVEDPSKLVSRPKVKKAIAQVRKLIGENGLVVVRASGTEPVLRIAIDAYDPKISAQALDILYKGLE